MDAERTAVLGNPSMPSSYAARRPITAPKR
jgi:hypothetical protein